jgi:hypothetical protein
MQTLRLVEIADGWLGRCAGAARDPLIRKAGRKQI